MMKFEGIEHCHYSYNEKLFRCVACSGVGVGGEAAYLMRTNRISGIPKRDYFDLGVSGSCLFQQIFAILYGCL